MEEDQIKSEVAEKGVDKEEGSGEKEVQMESPEVVEGQASSLTSSATSDSDTSSLVETWTLVDKEEAKHEDNEEILSQHEEGKGLDDKVPIGPSSSIGMSSQISTLST